MKKFFRLPMMYLIFGRYYQSNSTAKKPIEWLVLDYDASTNRVLLISRYGLDCKPYNEKYVDVTWETSTLRSWLNDEFLKAAFNTEEQKAIPTVTVSADKNPSYSTNPGNATQDKVFCLSVVEANKYFKNDEARMCAPTQHTINNNVYRNGTCNVSGKAICYWWLRSPGNVNKCAASIYYGGCVNSHGCGVDYRYDAVRPSIWLDISVANQI